MGDLRDGSAWSALVRAGLPDGAAHRDPRDPSFSPSEVRAALRAIAIDGLGASEAELLAAWLGGWRRQWPRCFEDVLGEEGEAIFRAARARVGDDNRYLKSRRIAIANLAALI